MKSILKISIITTILIIFSGCSGKLDISTMSTKNMNLKYEKELNKSITVTNVIDNREMSFFDMTKIDNVSFKEAIIMSLKKEELFSENGNYKLKVEILNMNQPFLGVGADLTVSLTVHYELSNESNIIWHKFIIKPYTATISDSYIGAIRFELAQEGAVRENINELLFELSKLNISQINAE